MAVIGRMDDQVEEVLIAPIARKYEEAAAKREREERARREEETRAESEKRDEPK